jgi:hypothetical protein
MMRRMLVSALIVMALLAQTGCNMPCQAAGPRIWIDQPLDGTHFPLGVITLQAHASDLDGVASIDFFVGADLLQSTPTSGGRFGEAMIEWTPPGPGVYQIGASGLDAAGNRGDRVSVQISVGDASPTPSPAGETGTPTPASLTVTPSITPKPAQGGPALTLTMNANCRLGPGKAYPTVDAFVQGQTVLIQGRNEDNSWFWVAKPGGSGHCWVSASVGSASGDWSGAPLVAAPPLPTTDTPLVDSTPPEITNVAVNPGSIEKDGCGSPNTFTLSATVSDASGVAYVNFHLLGPYPADTADGSLSGAGGDTYQAVIGPLADTGSWLVYVGASDAAGNSTQLGPWSLQVVCMQ